MNIWGYGFFWLTVHKVYNKYYLFLRCSLSTQRRLSERGECRQHWAHTHVKHANEGQRTEGQCGAANANQTHVVGWWCSLSVVCVCVSRSVLVKRMFRPAEEDLCPPPHKQAKEETHKRGTWWQDDTKAQCDFTLCPNDSSFSLFCTFMFRL